MKERPILFSGPMVKAILEGRKSMTRRVLKKQPLDILPMNVPNLWCTLDRKEPAPRGSIIACRYGVPGDLLWVRETYTETCDEYGAPIIAYRADGKASYIGTDQILADCPCAWSIDNYPACGKWRPSIFLPRWASRITLEITDVHVERLQKITEEDVARELTCETSDMFDDAEYCRFTKEMGCTVGDLKPSFRQLWDSIYDKKYPWASNPWTWVISFRRA